MYRTILFLVILVIPFSSTLIAADNVAVIVRITGDIQLLTDPSPTVKGEGPHAKFEENYYTVKKAKRGAKLDQGNVIQAGKDAKAKLIYKNGDQISVTSLSAYQVTWDQAQNKASTVDLLYGKIRGQIKKNGERSGLKIKTKSAVMGVRGTDFVVASRSSSGASEVTVLRGEVGVKAVDSTVEATSVKAGTVAEIGSDATEAPVETKPVKKSELIEIQKESSIAKSTEPMASPETAADEGGLEADTGELEALEKKAAENVLADIQVHDPQLYAAVTASGNEDISIDEINTMQVKANYEAAEPDPEVDETAQTEVALAVFSNEPLPEPPSLKLLENLGRQSESSEASEVRFSWDPSGSVDSYDVQISRQPDFKYLVAEGDIRGKLAFDAMLRPGQYSWRVRGKDAGGRQGNWSETRVAYVELGNVITATPPSEVVETNDEDEKGSREEQVRKYWVGVGLAPGSYDYKASGDSGEFSKSGQIGGGAIFIGMRPFEKWTFQFQRTGTSFNGIDEEDDEATRETSEIELLGQYHYPIAGLEVLGRAQFRDVEFFGLSDNAEDTSDLNLGMIGTGVRKDFGSNSAVQGSIDLNGYSQVKNDAELLGAKVLILNANYWHKPFSWPVYFTYGASRQSIELDLQHDQSKEEIGIDISYWRLFIAAEYGI
jgi:hypothetical protein